MLIFLSIFFSIQVIIKQKARFYKFLNRIRYENFWKLKDDVCWFIFIFLPGDPKEGSWNFWTRERRFVLCFRFVIKSSSPKSWWPLNYLHVFLFNVIKQRMYEKLLGLLLMCLMSNVLKGNYKCCLIMLL